MLNQEYQILKEFTQTPWRKYTFKQIKKLSRKSSESYVFSTLKKLVKLGILKQEKAGNVILYSLNISSKKAQIFAGFTAEYHCFQQKRIPFRNLEEISTKIPTSFYILIITGSYAHGTQRDDSDLDVAIICDDMMEPKRIYAELRLACELCIPEIHLYVFKKSEFLAMLLDKSANYGKETVKNNLLAFGGEEYYAILNEAIDHGFGDKNLS
ncbi:MAG: nucleotidyltransferase domain-containing protein [Nanoarchaeota archaeon]